MADAVHICYGVVIWAAFVLAAPLRGSPNPLNHVARFLGQLGGGLHHQEVEIPP